MRIGPDFGIDPPTQCFPRLRALQTHKGGGFERLVLSSQPCRVRIGTGLESNMFPTRAKRRIPRRK